MELLEATGLLAAGAFNLLPFHEDDDDDDFPGCCVIHCGPCAALKWFRDNAPHSLNRMLQKTHYASGSWVFWDAENDGVNWVLVQSIWDRHKGCSSVGGVHEPCKEEEDDTEAESPETVV